MMVDQIVAKRQPLGLLFVTLLLLCGVLVLGGCKTGRKPVSGKGVDNPAKHVAVLLDKGKLQEAVTVVVAEEEFFASSYGDPKVRGVLDRFAVRLAVHNEPFFMGLESRLKTIRWPVPASEWLEVRKELDSVEVDLNAFLKKAPFQYAIYRPEAYDRVVAALNDKRSEIRASAPEVFASYDIASSKSFFDEYPVAVDRGLVLRRNEEKWSKELKGYSKQESDRFFAAYGTYLPKSAKEIAAQKYFDSLCPNPKKASLKEILSAFRKCQEAGLPLKDIPGLKVAFLQVTSPDLIKEKALDFPLSVKVDVPLNATRASMRKMFSHPAVKEADILILVNIALSKAVRVAERNERFHSTYINSYKKIENPEYAIVKAELEAASTEFHQAQAQADYTWGASVIEKLIVSDTKQERIVRTQKRLTSLKDRMRTTPMFIDVPEYSPYYVTKAHMDIYKMATVNYYVIDKRNRRYFRDTFDYTEKAFFTVCYDLHDTDKNRETFLQTSVLEKDVVRHELEPMVVKLSDLLEQYVNTPSQWKRYTSMASIHRAVAADSDRAQKQHYDAKYGYDKYYDKRFDSVVLVRNLGSGLGSGFYVTEDMILTNYHVVEENDYVRLRMFNKREMMGRVIARDVQLDLALIEADVKGKPVCFYDRNEIPLGVTLEGIGHPNGLYFSITRGALSSVRKERPINYPESKRKNLYIQTDAALSGGNSGGPLFYRNKVVGVNDWGFVRTSKLRNAEGLHFAIHYSEVFKFLDRHGIEVCKGSE